jgi:PAS domain S-box-containing protein
VTTLVQTSEINAIGKAPWYETIFNAATIGIIIVDADGYINKLNSYAEKLFGYQKNELLGKSVEVLIPLTISQAHIGQRKSFLRNPAARPMGVGRDLQALKKNGDIFPVEVGLNPFQHNDEVMVAAFVVDITHRKLQEALVKEQAKELERFSKRVHELNTALRQEATAREHALAKSKLELQQKESELNQSFQKELQLMELKSRFVTMASHEFRTPLTTILSSVSLIARYEGTGEADKRAKHVRRIKQAVVDMKDILDDFLSMSRLEEGRIELRPEAFTSDELTKQVDEIVNEMQRLAKPGQIITVKIDVQQDVLLDKNMLRHVLTNVISNAIKFSPEQTPIDLHCKRSINQLILAVEDHGIGIPEHDQKHLFERFFRAQNADNIQGTGLGLHIVKRYVDLSGGQVEVASELFKGTKITVMIPQRVSSLEDNDHSKR